MMADDLLLPINITPSTRIIAKLQLAMFLKFSVLIVLLVRIASAEAQDLNFIYNGFANPTDLKLTLDGIADITEKGILMLTNDTKQKTGHAFYPNPVTFKDTPNGTAFSFSTNFVFAIRSQYPTLSSPGLAFVISPTRGLLLNLPSQYLGLFSEPNNGESTNHVFAVELDTVMSTEFNDINNNHVGIDINGLNSVESSSAGYYDGGRFKNLTLSSGQEMRVWVEYNGSQNQIEVTLAPIGVAIKPQTPLLSLKYDLSPILNQAMYVGFSSSTGSVPTSHYVMGWSFRIEAQSSLPELPRIGDKKVSKLLTIGMPVIAGSLILQILLAISVAVCAIRRKKYAELLEDWELEYGPQRFKYEELYKATKGFGEKMLLGVGGFGHVYRGILPTSKIEIAVKRVSHKSRQGMKEFVAEIVSLGRLRHRNLVQLLGYCRRNGELLLVYDYMPNGSLDKYIYSNPEVTLNWSQRFRVIKGVASGLLYLHEEWEQVVIHRDVKANNVLLDEELNGRLGDFGLARLSDHGTDPQTTHVAGTLGYLAPEHARTGRATTRTDVFAFGAFILEVACGRRPIETQGLEVDIVLADRVFSCWHRRNILEAKDQKLGTDFVFEEVELVLKLGLLCSRSQPAARPSMRQVVQYLEGDIALPELSLLRLSSTGLAFAHDEGFDDVAMSYQSSYAPESTLLSGGR